MHSFDVFETCLIRTVAMPDDLFYLVAKSVLSRRSTAWEKEEVVELARLRIAAGQRAGDASSQDHVHLGEIYRHFDLSHWGISPQEMMEEELRLEAESVRPVARTRRQLERLRDEGERIVFISDTPIPTVHLKKMLEDAGVALPGERLYASGDLGLSKASGRLFEYVRDVEGVDFEDWVHHGDNPLGDLSVPWSKGIRTVEYRDSDLTRYERIHLMAGTAETWVRSLVAGVSRVARLTTDEEGNHPFHGVAAGVAGPLLTYFVAWVLHEATRAGLERLYFVSRDGDALLHIVRALQEHSDGPECRYLYGSRQAWTLAALETLNREKFDLLTVATSKTLIDLLAKIGLGVSDVSHLLGEFGLPLSDPNKRLDNEEFDRFWSLIQHPDIAELVLERSKKRREAALAYFVQEGLTSSDSWALVDVGWHLSSQWALKSILDTVGRGDSVRGFYLSLSNYRRPMADTGPYRALFMPQDGIEVQHLQDHALVVEEVFFSANHGAVSGYRFEAGESVPVFQESFNHDERQRILADLRRVISTYAGEAIRAGILPTHLHDMRQGALGASSEFLTSPGRAEAKTLSTFVAIDDPMHQLSRAKALAGPMGFYEVKARFAAKNLGRSRRVRELRRNPTRYHWDEASLVLSKTWIRALLRVASLIDLRKTIEMPRRTLRRFF